MVLGNLNGKMVRLVLNFVRTLCFKFINKLLGNNGRLSSLLLGNRGRSLNGILFKIEVNTLIRTLISYDWSL